MTNQHPITPPLELVGQWSETWIDAKVKHDGLIDFIATQAAQWGADQELEACVELLSDLGGDGAMVRRYRRPKPPSLKEQALLQLDTLSADLTMHGMGCDLFQIRRALEALPND
jgi:hypothetical protein